MRARTALPLAEEFAPAPAAHELERWRAADHAARPGRLTALRARAAEERLDALLLTSHADARYFSGMEFGPNEEPVAGSSGWLLVSGDDLAVLVDSRYTVQARREAHWRPHSTTAVTQVKRLAAGWWRTAFDAVDLIHRRCDMPCGSASLQLQRV